MAKWAVCIWLRLMYVPISKGNCFRPRELHWLPYYRMFSYYSWNDRKYLPPIGLCAFPFLDAGFSKSGVLGLAWIGFLNIFAARTNSQTARQTTPTSYSNTFGFSFAIRVTSDVISRSQVDLTHKCRLSNFVSLIFVSPISTIV